MYTPQRQDPRFGAIKPEGSLGLIYLAGALREHGCDVKVLDCSVGDTHHNLNDTFYKQTVLPNGMIRVGMSIEDIIASAHDYDVIGISSIFTAQTTMAVEVIRAIAYTYPDKLIITGGVNARSQQDLFFGAGVDIICTSEADSTIMGILEVLRKGSLDISSIEGISYRAPDGTIRRNHMLNTVTNLDNLPIPAWDLLPLQKYWEIARPHGGGFSASNPVAYAPMMTSRGCPFKCDFCHVGMEMDGSESGNLRKLRVKSIERVVREILILKGLGVRHVFLEDDSLLGRKERAKNIFQEIAKLGMRLSGVNGINIAHLCTTQSGTSSVDIETLELMAAAGFTKFMLPVESGSQRIIDKYATGKLSLERHDIVGLIKETQRLGIEVGANYTFGYPDETPEEVAQTLELARRHVAEGLKNANFMIITPFPGTAFYERVVRENLFLPGTQIDELDWTKVSIKTLVPKARLEEVISNEWASINPQERVNRIRGLAPQASSSRS